VDHILKCNYYSQGCDGGFSLEIARFAKENKLVSANDWEQILRNEIDNDSCYNANKRSNVFFLIFNFQSSARCSSKAI
jgi:hypothetical protein